MKISSLFLLFAILLVGSCKQNYTPKPKSYPRIEYPQKSYQKFAGDCPFSFEYPVYARIENDNSRDAQPCWFNILYLPFNARLHLSYKPISDLKQLNQYTEDARDLVYKHTVKAEEIIENIINSKNPGVYGMYYNLQGNTASAIQFYLTDSNRHYLRGALYFNVHINRDSLDPMISFLRDDINRMINTFNWKETGKK
jgi:gliding motility-associated lipoprotein GldD